MNDYKDNYKINRRRTNRDRTIENGSSRYRTAPDDLGRAQETGQKTGRTVIRHPLLAAVIVAGFALFSLGLVYTVLGTPEGPEPRPEAMSIVEPASAPDRTSASVPTGTAAVALDAQRIELPTGSAYVFTFGVMAGSDAPVSLQFTTGQMYDFVVRQEGREVWRWSDGRAFHQAVHTRTIEPGTLQTHVHVWDGRDAAGEPVSGTVTVSATLTARSGMETAELQLYLN